MLFYNQIKREFSQSCWKRGQIFYRQNRLKDVRLQSNHVLARLDQDSVSIEMARGTIINSKCTCGHTCGGQQQLANGRCEHVAALGIWVVERGSLLRAGILEKTTVASEKKKPMPATPVLFVRAVFSGKAFHSIALEGAVRYVDLKTGKNKVEPLSRLMRQTTPFVWKNSEGQYIRVSVDPIPILQSIEVPKMHINGADALDKLVSILTYEDTRKVVRHHFIENLEVDPEPLKLTGLHIGKKIENDRILSYQFSNSKLTISSQELMEHARFGRLCPNYVWVEKLNKIFKFETSLNTINRLANRSGILNLDKFEGVEAIATFSRLEDCEQSPLHPLAAYRFSLELGVENFSVDVEWKEFYEWKKQFERKRLPQLPAVRYGFDLRDYQKNGLSWLWSLFHRRLAALLADDMGLGKTHQVMALLTSLYLSRSHKPKKPSLVIAPTSVVAAWKQKLEKYQTGLTWYIFHGKDRELPPQNTHLVLTTYGILQKETALREQSWHLVILDEAQAVKNPSTISSRASRVLRCEYRIALTGTPVENQALDLWSIMEFLLPGYLGGLARFKRLYGYGREIPSKEQAEMLRRLVAPFLLRRTKSQVLTQLPEKTEEVLECGLTAIQNRKYSAYLNSTEAQRIRDDLKGDAKVDYASILALLTRLKQVCDHPKLPTYGKSKKKKIDPLESGKWETFEEIINEALGSNLKIVVFTQYLGMLDIIGDWLKSHQIGFIELRGDTRDRSAVLEKFSNDPDCKVFLCSLLAGGLGIDLTSASVCIHFDRWWNPAKENQATDRLHRIGQTRGVQVFKLQCPNTIEERIAAIIESKKELAGTLIEESSTGLKAFSRAELLELLSNTQSSKE